MKPEKEWLSVSFRPENFIPGLVIGFILGLFLDLSKPSKGNVKKGYFLPSKYQQLSPTSNDGDQELKLVSVRLYRLVYFNFAVWFIVTFIWNSVELEMVSVRDCDGL